LKILIVDDSSFARRSVMKFLKRDFPDAEYLMAENGEEGLALFFSDNPDFVVLDLLMPIIDGSEFVERLGEKKETGKIIVLSADVQEKVKTQLLEKGILDFINKPINAPKAAEVAEKMRTVYAGS